MFNTIYTDMENNKIECFLDVNFIPRIGELVILSYDKFKYHQIQCIVYPLCDKDKNQTVIIKCKEL